MLSDRKSRVVGEWLQRTIRTYPQSTFSSQEQDPFRNPVWNTLNEGLATLFDQVIVPTDPTAASDALDRIIRLRAVQDFSAGEAVSFIFLLKQVLRDEIAGEGAPRGDELAALEDRIDRLALLAFDTFMKCREQIYQIRANEARRMACLKI
jgi:RsbRD-like negative regulator of sigma factor